MESKVDIWMPLSIGDYLADTSHLNTLQHGAYLLMLMHYWRKGPLPNDPSTLANITKLPMDAWSINQAVLMQFYFVGEDGLLHQKRSDKERAGALEKRSKSNKKAKGAANKRWADARSNAPRSASSNAPEMLESCPLPSPLDEKTTPLTPAKVDHFEGMELQLANDLFREFRIPSDAGLTRIAGQALVFECDRLGSPEKAVDGMRAAMKEAKARGDTINRFWFQDQRYDAKKEVGNGNNGQPGTNGAGQRSATAARVGNNLDALGEALAKRGLEEFRPGSGGPDKALSQPRLEGRTGSVSGGLREAGSEVLDFGGGRRTSGASDKAGPTILPPAG